MDKKNISEYEERIENLSEEKRNIIDTNIETLIKNNKIKNNVENQIITMTNILFKIKCLMNDEWVQDAKNDRTYSMWDGLAVANRIIYDYYEKNIRG